MRWGNISWKMCRIAAEEFEGDEMEINVFPNGSLGSKFVDVQTTLTGTKGQKGSMR